MTQITFASFASYFLRHRLYVFDDDDNRGGGVVVTHVTAADIQIELRYDKEEGKVNEKHIKCLQC